MPRQGFTFKKNSLEIEVEGKTYKAKPELSNEQIKESFEKCAAKMEAYDIREGASIDDEMRYVTEAIRENVDFVFGDGSFDQMVDGFDIDISILLQLYGYITASFSASLTTAIYDVAKKYSPDRVKSKK